MPGVQDVVPIQVLLTNCRVSLDVVVFHGVPPTKLRTARDLHLVAGNWDLFEQRRDAGLVGQALARRRGLRVGERFSIGETTVTIAGVYTAAPAAEENFLYTHLEFLQRTPGINAVGTVTQFEIGLADGADAEAVARDIDNRFKGGPIPTDTRSKGVFEASAVGDLAELVGLARYLGYVCIGLMLALVATTTVMAVQDRVREHAVLQTLGFSGAHIFGLVLSESLIVSLAGGVLGVGSALGTLAWSGLALSTEGVTVAFSSSFGVAATGLGVAVAIGVLASLVPAWQAARAEIVHSLRYV
jgi:putative ABC transport system permease protein